jgi:hypothetical protein
MTTEASDSRFLESAAAAPTRTRDVALIRHALEHSVTRREFEAVGGALKRLEKSLRAERR